MVLCIDDTIFTGPDSEAVNHEIKSLGVVDDEKHHTFELRDEGKVRNLLGIQIKKTGPQEFYLSQPGLTEKGLKMAGMEHCSGADTPASSVSLSTDALGDPPFS